MQSIAKQLQDANFAVDALRVYRDFLTDNSINPAVLQQYGGRDLATVRKEAQARMDAIIAKLSGEAGAAALAQAAANRDLPALSLRAIREVVAGGLPVPDISPQMDANRQRQVVTRSRGGAGTSRNDVDHQIYDDLASRMWQVSTVWQKKGISPADVCTVLEQLVFPANRPNELLLFEQPLGEDWWTPKSIGRLLAAWSLRAGRGESLSKLIEARQGSPTDILSGHVLLVQYHLAAADQDRVRSELKAIGNLVESGKLTGWAETAVHAIGPSFIDSRFTADAAPLLTKALAAIKSTSQRYEGPRDDSPLTRLIRFYLHQGDFKSAQLVVDEHHARISRLPNQLGASKATRS